MYALDVRASSGEVVSGKAGSQVTLQGAEEVVAQTGGVHKPQEFVNSNMPFSSGNTPPGVHKPVEIVTEFGAEQPQELALRQTTVQPVMAHEVEGEYELVEERQLALPKPTPLGLGGRPRILNDDLINKLFMLVSVGFSRRQAAAYLGISPSAISNMASRQPEFAEELRRAEELNLLQSEMTLMAAARKNWRAAAWYLQFKAKNPPPLSEEEKEERHQAQLADQRRSAELTAEWVAGTERAMSRRSDPLPATYAKRSKKR